MTKYGVGTVACNWVRTDGQELTFVSEMCPTKLPLLWKIEGKLYLVPLEVIKNARRLLRDRQAYCDVYEDWKTADPVCILLDQTIMLHLNAHNLDVLTEHEYLQEHHDDAEGNAP